MERVKEEAEEEEEEGVKEVEEEENEGMERSRMGERMRRGRQRALLPLRLDSAAAASPALVLGVQLAAFIPQKKKLIKRRRDFPSTRYPS